MKIGILGSGVVATTLGKGFLDSGHEVRLGSREASKVAKWSDHAHASAGTFDDAAAFGEVVVLALKGTVVLDALKLLSPGALDGKTVIDACNPIADAAPVNGILVYFTGPNDSLMERLQSAFPAAHFVKAFSCVGNAFMYKPAFAGGPPTMFIAGNSDAAKATVRGILTQFGWDAEDIGKVEGARAIEPLCQLWCAPGMQRGQWTHAFKLLRL